MVSARAGTRPESRSRSRGVIQDSPGAQGPVIAGRVCDGYLSRQAPDARRAERLGAASRAIEVPLSAPSSSLQGIFANILAAIVSLGNYIVIILSWRAATTHTRIVAPGTTTCLPLRTSPCNVNWVHIRRCNSSDLNLPRAAGFHTGRKGALRHQCKRTRYCRRNRQTHSYCHISKLL